MSTNQFLAERMLATMYKIGELSKLCQIPVKTLRYYDREGLLVPDEIDHFTGYRYYSASRLADCNRIIVLKELGFTLDEIKMRMKAISTDDVLTLIETKEIELKNTILQTELRLRRLETRKKIIKEGGIKMFDVIIRSTDTLRVAILRNIWTSKEEAFTEIDNIRNKLPQNILGKRAIIINYETEYRENYFDLGVCIEITRSLPLDSDYVEKVIVLPSDVAMLICQKHELEEAYKTLIKQLEEDSCQIVGAYYEVYHDDGTVELKVPVYKLSPLANKHQNDDINLPFENDTDAIGKWKFLDVLPSEEQFCYGHEKSNQGVWLQDLYFLPNGEQFWAVSGWTKGWLFTSCGYPKRTYKNKYQIKTLDHKKLMFIQMKDYDHESRGGMPTVWVYEKVSDKVFTKDEIRIRDNTDIPFVLEDSVLGTWKVRDFVLTTKVFDPSKQNFSKEGLFFKQVEFKKNGNATALYGQKDPYELFWTKGLLLDKKNGIAEAYEIKVIDSIEYLFIEWKSGDYTYGGRKPYWFVFVRV